MTTLVVGAEIPAQVVHFTREDLRAYANASGDHNPIHLDDAVAAAVGLPGVIAHGMLTMGHTARVISDFVGGVEKVQSFSVRFTRPVVVPPQDAQPNSAELTISGVVTAIDESTAMATIAINVIFNGQTVLARAEARVSIS
ncbi:MAG: acyl dehydratase [Actinobacteria bacterium]|nr:acyl dehydratase [Actinomycetota bacterium]